MVGKMHEDPSCIFLAGGGKFECRTIDSDFNPIREEDTFGAQT